MTLEGKSLYPLKGKGNKRIEFNFNGQTKEGKVKKKFFDSLNDHHKIIIMEKGLGAWFKPCRFISVEAWEVWQGIQKAIETFKELKERDKQK